MTFVYSGTLTSQQRQWIQDAIARSSFPFDNLAVTVTFVAVVEPPCPGHKDMMCTVDDGGGNYTVHIRNNLDDINGQIAQMLPNPSEIKTLYMETVMHELGHVIHFNIVNSDALKTTVAAYFEREGSTGDGYPVGTLADWDSLDVPWEDRVQEAVAEVIKDAALPSRHRVYDNRTNWSITRAGFDALVMLLAP